MHYRRWQIHGDPFETANKPRSCSIEGCDREHYGRGYCDPHWKRWWRHGDPLRGGPIRPRYADDDICAVEGCAERAQVNSMCRIHNGRNSRHGDPSVLARHRDHAEAFQAYVDTSGDCHLWNGPARGPYGVIRVNGEYQAAHRYAWERVNGPIPEGMEINHRCWVKKCVNPDHLETVTPAQNTSYQSGPRRDNKSTGIRNVYPNRDGFMVQITKNRQYHYCGTYPTIEEAAAVAKATRKELFGAYAGRG